MNAPALQHGYDYAGENVIGWVASEKMDGWRAYWTGSELITRSGNAYTAPAALTAALPSDIPLDGELWAGRGRTHRDVNASIRSGQWGALRFVAFDAPLYVGSWRKRLSEAGRYAETVDATVIESEAGLLALFYEVTNSGGEGLMLRSPSPVRYWPGRTGNLLKLKEVQNVAH